MIVLGISGGHDAGWCVVKNGEILGAFEKERFTKKRHDSGEVVSLISLSLKKLGMTINDINLIATSKPVHKNTDSGLLKLSGDDYKQPDEWTTQIVEIFNKVLPCISVAHHLSHAAYAYYTSPFHQGKTAAITWDGGGDFYTEDAYSSTTISSWNNGRLEWLKRIDNSDFGSLWFTYSRAIFGDGNMAGKLMGLAAYGSDTLLEAFRDRFLAPVSGILEGARTVKNCWPDYLDPPFLPKNPDWKDKLVQDVAFAIQKITEEAGMSLIEKFASVVENENLVLGGGVTLNGYLNTMIKQSNLFKNVFIPPSVHDGGICVGAALFATHHVFNIPKSTDVNKGMDLAYLGHLYSTNEIKETIHNFKHLNPQKVDKETAIMKAIESLQNGKVVSWYEGRSEHGPRALGNRSILALPHSKNMKDFLNNKIKFREEFRPIAPVVLEEEASLFFEMDWASPYMMYIVKAYQKWKDLIPSGLHIDDTSRVQTVTQDISLGKIVAGIRDKTGIGCVLNTSFNIKTPIVETPADAIEAFMQVPIDALYLDGYWLQKK